MRAVSPLARCLAASMLMDGALYLILIAVPLRAIDLRATPLQLGLLPLLVSAIYIGAALYFGHRSDRWPRMRMARTGAALRAVITLALALPRSIGGLMAWLPWLGICSGLFWPALQATVGEIRPEAELGKNLGRFNISWSVGKMCGFLFGGLIVAHAGYRAAFYLASAMTLAVALVLPGSAQENAGIPEPGAPDAAGESDARAPVAAPRAGPRAAAEAARRRDWRWIGWLANFVLFGIGATLNYQYPKLMISLGFTGREFGIFLAGVYLFQTLTFAALGAWKGWHFRLGPLLAAQAASLVALVALGRLHTLPLIWATAPAIGLGLGVSYSSSIFYSLYRQEVPGRSTGAHEALLGTGTFVLPLAGGWAAQLSGSLLAPYALCAVALASVMAVEWWLVARGVPVADGKSG